MTPSNSAYSFFDRPLPSFLANIHRMVRHLRLEPRPPQKSAKIVVAYKNITIKRGRNHKIADFHWRPDFTNSVVTTFLFAVSSDLHEWRNDGHTVSS